MYLGKGQDCRGSTATPHRELPHNSPATVKGIYALTRALLFAFAFMLLPRSHRQPSCSFCYWSQFNCCNSTKSKAPPTDQAGDHHIPTSHNSRTSNRNSSLTLTSLIFWVYSANANRPARGWHSQTVASADISSCYNRQLSWVSAYHCCTCTSNWIYNRMTSSQLVTAAAAASHRLLS